MLQRADHKRRTAVLARMATRRVGYVPTHVASSGQDWLLLSGAYKRDPRLHYTARPQHAIWRIYAEVSVAGTAEKGRAPLEAVVRSFPQADRTGACQWRGGDGRI